MLTARVATQISFTTREGLSIDGCKLRANHGKTAIANKSDASIWSKRRRTTDCQPHRLSVQELATSAAATKTIEHRAWETRIVSDAICFPAVDGISKTVRATAPILRNFSDPKLSKCFTKEQE